MLKVNALMALSPESACPTHPALVKAIAKKVLEIGAEPFISDSPGGMIANAGDVFEKIGYNKIAKELGIKIIPMQVEGSKEFNTEICKCLKSFQISRVALEADAIINIPKLKTHMLMLFTGAIKNMFGTVPGFYKSQMHFLAPHPDDFAALLVDIYGTVKPTLNIMDAVVGMEGKGPSAGKPRNIGLILAASDGVAMDAVASSIIGFDPHEILTTKIASEHDLGVRDLDKINILGEFPPKIYDFEKTYTSFNATRRIPRSVYRIVQSVIKRIKVYPEIDKKRCVACNTCVKACPMKCITVEKGKKYKIDHKKCIMCFCCHELCPYKAIELKGNILARILPFAK